jgi:hypothetical protein
LFFGGAAHVLTNETKHKRAAEKQKWEQNIAESINRPPLTGFVKRPWLIIREIKNANAAARRLHIGYRSLVTRGSIKPRTITKQFYFPLPVTPLGVSCL